MDTDSEARQILFTFTISGIAAEKFAVVRMEAREAISELYQLEVDLVSSDETVDPMQAVNQGATLVIDRDGDITRFQGIVVGFEQRERGPEFTAYHAVVAPRLWNLGLTRQCQIFLDKSVTDIIGEVLQENGLADGEDYEIQATGSYPAREYVVQYQESDLEFIFRLMEHEGIFYFFQHGEEKEKLIIADSKDIHEPIEGEAVVKFRDARAINPGGEAVGALGLRSHNLAQQVILKDYNYRRPSLEIRGEAPVFDGGFGNWMQYGDHFKDPDAGNHLALVRAEELLCRQNLYLGQSGCRHFRSGATFELEDHFRSTSDQEYLLVEVNHSGSQLGVIGTASGGAPTRPSYTNRFTAIPAATQFRPLRVTPRPRIYGFMHAVIDAGGSGQYAEVDDQGRYKVKLPFDLSDASDGKASHFIRMAQPYSGGGMGMHFPLHKGTEVLLIHLDGDPDRPLIVGSVPNPDTASPVTGANQTQCVIHTGGNNTIVIEDSDGGQRIAMTSPTGNTYFSIGAPPA